MRNSIHTKVAARLLVALGLLSLSPAPGGAQIRSQDLAWATLEDLLNVQITSASRKEQRADEAPAAVSVLTQDDIRRSGIHTLPELFRLVPGVQVAEINSSSWAVSIRGFNDQFSNKLLVLVDGRSIYKRNTSGVFWDAEDLVLDDIDRIEVVRGPGGAVWGANAVNGVINIVTKAAKDTQGALVRVGGGTFDRAHINARYGGSFGSASYRVYSQVTDRSDTTLADRTPAHDDWKVLTNGARVDWARGANEWTVDGSFRSGDAHPLWKSLEGPTPGVPPRTDTHSVFHNGSVLGRWTHRGDNGSSLQVQSVGATSYRSDLVTERENTFDIDLQYQMKLGARNDVVAGGGYRVVDNTTSKSFSFSMIPSTSNTAVVSMFAQDEIALGDRLRVMLGSKLEHDTFAGWGLQPTARVMWDPARRQHLWASVSRALRTPSNKDLFIRLNVAVVPGERSPIVIGFLGNPDYRNEELLDTEVGYRVELGSTVSLDIATFRGHYKGLTTNEPVAPVFETTPGPPHLFIARRYGNNLQADTSGIEIAAHVTPVPAWRVDASYSGFRLTPHLDAASQDTAAATFDGNAPGHQWQIHSSVRLGPRTEANAALFYTGRLRNLGIPAYTRADARVEVRLTRNLSAIAAGRNLLTPVHVEYFTPVMVSTLVPRSADFQLLWQF